MVWVVGWSGLHQAAGWTIANKIFIVFLINDLRPTLYKLNQLLHNLFTSWQRLYIAMKCHEVAQHRHIVIELHQFCSPVPWT